MQLKHALAICSLSLLGPVTATTVSTSGTSGYQFGYMIAGVFTSFTNTGENAAEFDVGTLGGTGTFNVFAPLDETPPTFGTAGALQGKWVGNASDNSAAASAFDGQVIWVRISTNYGGVQSTGYFRDTTTETLVNFPTNGFGTSDSVVFNSSTLDLVSPFSTGTWTIDTVNSRIYLNAIPEPSTLLLCGVGALSLVRRRRRS